MIPCNPSREVVKKQTGNGEIGGKGIPHCSNQL